MDVVVESAVIEKILEYLITGFPNYIFLDFVKFENSAEMSLFQNHFFSFKFKSRVKCASRRLHITVTFPTYVRSIDLRIRLSNLKSNDYVSTSHYSFFQHGLVMLLCLI